jgi:ribonuclease T
VSNATLLKHRFRGYFPVICDVETGGFNASTDALLEVAFVTLTLNDDLMLKPAEKISFHVEPFEGANLEREALEFTGIDPFNPLRGAINESEALGECFKLIRKEQKKHGCKRSVIVAHNAAFDFGFINSAIERNDIKRSPFHPFTTFDTSTLSGFVYGQTVLAKACEAARLDFCNQSAHSALYDAEKTAELFCKMVNKWQELGGWMWPDEID